MVTEWRCSSRRLIRHDILNGDSDTWTVGTTGPVVGTSNTIFQIVLNFSNKLIISLKEIMNLSHGY